MKSVDAPRFGTWLLERTGGRYRREALVGDLIEELSLGRSRLWFWRQILHAVCSGLRLGMRHHDRGGSGYTTVEQSRFARHWREYRGLMLFLILMCSFRSAWADWVYVPTGSMNPTILEGDRLLVDKHVYGLRVPFSLVHLTNGENPSRGDIIVFDSPQGGTSLVKRLIAVPGDTVALDGEQLIVNGVSAQYAPGDGSELRALLQATQSHDPVVLRESGVAREHDTLLLPDRRHSGLVGAV